LQMFCQEDLITTHLDFNDSKTLKSLLGLHKFDKDSATIFWM
jgi:hypothetical protein